MIGIKLRSDHTEDRFTQASRQRSRFYDETAVGEEDRALEISSARNSSSIVRALSQTDRFLRSQIPFPRMRISFRSG